MWGHAQGYLTPWTTSSPELRAWPHQFQPGMCTPFPQSVGRPGPPALPWCMTPPSHCVDVQRDQQYSQQAQQHAMQHWKSDLQKHPEEPSASADMSHESDSDTDITRKARKICDLHMKQVTQSMEDEECALRLLESLQSTNDERDNLGCTMSTLAMADDADTKAFARDITSAVADFLNGTETDRDYANESDDELEPDLASISSTTTTVASQGSNFVIENNGGKGGVDSDEACCMAALNEAAAAALAVPASVQVLWDELLCRCRRAETAMQLSCLELLRRLADLNHDDSDLWGPILGPYIQDVHSQLYLRTEPSSLLPQAMEHSDKLQHPARIRIEGTSTGMCQSKCGVAAAASCGSLWLSQVRAGGRPVYRGVCFSPSWKLSTNELRYAGKGFWTYSRSGQFTVQLTSDTLSVKGLLGEKLWIEKSPKVGRERVLTLTELDSMHW